MAGEVPGRLSSFSFSLSLFTSRETSFQNTEVSWSPPLSRPPKSSGCSACLRLRARSALVFSHPPATFRLFHASSPVFCFRLFCTITVWRGTEAPFTLWMNRVYCASKTLRIEMMKNSSGRDYISGELNRDSQTIDENYQAIAKTKWFLHKYEQFVISRWDTSHALFLSWIELKSIFFLARI